MRQQLSMRQEQLAGSAAFGFDIGHSGIKLRLAMLDRPNERYSALIPTVVMPASVIADENTARVAATETVTIGNESYFFGETAILQGDSTVFSGQDREWIRTRVHDVLILGAWRKAMALIGCQPRNINLALGLPMAFFKSQKDELKARALELISPLLQDGQRLKILVRPQSLVPLINRQHLASGYLNEDYNSQAESWGVINVGHFTTDVAILLRTQIRDSAGDSLPGVTKVYSGVTTEFQSRGWPTVLESIDEAIRTRTVLDFGQRHDVSAIVDAAIKPLSEVIVSSTKTLFGDTARRLNGIIVAGGGAPLVFDAIKDVFPNALIDEEGRMSVAEGLCRFAMFALHLDEMETA